MSQINPAVPRYASLQDAADYLGGVSTTTVRRMIARGDIRAHRLPGSRLIRVDLNEVDRAIAIKQIPAAGAGGGSAA